jgi:hypothetical protein
MTLAGYALDQLNKTVASKGKTKLSVRLHNYAAFLSFFGLSQLTGVNPTFTACCTSRRPCPLSSS